MSSFDKSDDGCWVVSDEECNVEPWSPDVMLPFEVVMLPFDDVMLPLDDVISALGDVTLRGSSDIANNSVNVARSSPLGWSLKLFE